MHILHVTKKYPNAIGGDAVVVSNLVRLQISSGHDVAILTSNCHDILEEDRIYKFGLKDTGDGLDHISFRRLISLVILLVKSFSVIGRERPDVIHAHSVDLTFFVSLAAHFYHVPIVHTFHIVSFNDPQQSAVRRKTELQLLRGSRVRAVTAPNDYEVESLRRAGVKNVYLVLNGIDLRHWKCVRRSPREGGLFRFIAVGRLEKQKGFEYLIEAVEHLVHRTDLPFHVLIVGHGSEHARLSSLIHELHVTPWICLSGAQSSDVVKQLYTHSDALVISSLWETTPLTLLEAWALGLPVVSTPVGILRYERADRVAGMIECKSAESLSNKMNLILTNPGLSSILRENGSAEVKNYQWSSIAHVVQHVYSEVLT